MVDEIGSIIKNLGFSEEEARLYLHLNEHGVSTALELSRELKIPRSSVYRYLENMQKCGLVEEILNGKTRTFVSTDPGNFAMLIKNREAEIERQKILSDELIKILENKTPRTSIKTDVKHYNGIDGLKQITWNSLKARGALRILEIEEMDKIFDYGFSEKVRQEFVRREVTVHELTNQKSFNAWTKIQRFYEEFWKCRYLDPKILRIDSEVLIYNDVYALYGYKDEEIWGVEIYNQNLAKMQKQNFDAYWKMAKRMKVSEGGASKVVKEK
jgi:sugar-specific transcriptional regulator TrmB